MLRVYRAPDRIPGEMTLLADADTWRALLAALSRLTDANSLRLLRAIQGEIARASTQPVARVRLPAEQAQLILDLAVKRS